MKKFLGLILVWFSMLPMVSASLIEIKEGIDEIKDINDYTFIATDSERNWTIDSLLEVNRFKEKLTTSNNIGFTNAGKWLNFSVKNSTGKTIDYVYTLNMSVINDIKFYETQNGQLLRSIETGELKDINTRDIKHRRFAFNINIPAGQQRAYYLYLYNDGDSMYLPFALKQKSLFYEKDFFDSLLIGVYFGVLLFIVIFNIFYIITLREVYYIYYTLYLVFATLFMLNIEGVTHRMFFSELAPFSDIFTVFFVGVLNFSLLSFNSSYFKHNHGEIIYSHISTALKIIAVYGVFGSLLPYPYYLTAVFAVLALTPVVFLFLLTNSFVMLRRKVESATYFFFAYLTGGFGVTVYVLRDLAILPDNLFSEHAMKITLMLESIIFFFAIMQRIKMNRQRAHNELVEKNRELNEQRFKLSEANMELEKLSIVARETDNSVAIYDAQATMEWYNDGFYKIFGYADKLHGQNFSIQSIYPNSEIKELVQIALNLKESVVFETQIPGRGVTVKWIFTTLTPILDELGCVTKLIAIDSDITELKKTQSELEGAKNRAEEANRLKTAFLSNVSHELRTPLNSIIGFSQLLLMKNFEDKKRISFLKLINDNGNHLLNLISDIIDISKIESGHMELHVSPVNINSLINELHDQFSMQTKNSGKEFDILKTISLPDAQAVLGTDPVKLRQVLLNMIGNSIKFTSQGHIHFGYLIHGKRIEFFVEDTGIGLTEEEINIVFHRFRQADDSITRKYGGTGLGLSISKGLIELMGGKLQVHSEKGKGTRISFVFEQEIEFDASVDKKLTDHMVSNKLENRKVLVVEDDATNFDFLSEVLNENKAIVYHAENASMAIDIFEEVDLDLILLDIQLPDKNGYELAVDIRKQNTDIPIIAQTAYAYAEAKAKCFESGCSDYISKPIDYQLLITKIEKFLSPTEKTHIFGK